MIELDNISFTYSNGTKALENISMSFPQEHITAIIGESGSGKTTLLKIIGRFLKPNTGRVLLNGSDIASMMSLDLRRTVGIVFQNLYLFPHLSVLENLMLAPLKVLKGKRSDVTEQSMEVLERLGIAELKDSYPSRISGGQAQRVAIARSLMLNPEYLLLDEPTSALDVVTTESFAEWLLELRTETSFLLVTHDLPFVRKIASYGMLLSGGKIIAKGSIGELLERAKVP
jgi:ABC-type polar amino acid transport system ATPase subunit